MAFNLARSDSASKETIADRHTLEGADMLPPLSWNDAPQDTHSFALVGEDPEEPGGILADWLLHNVTPARERVPGFGEKDLSLPWGAAQGRNDSGNVGYGGPCPLMGVIHPFAFRL